MDDSQDKTRMPAGLFRGYKLEDVPEWYLLFYVKKSSPNYENQHVHDYVKKLNLKKL